MADRRPPPAPAGFVSLGALKGRPVDPAAALAEIRRIYFRTTRETIEGDLAHAIELLKTIPSEEAREKASVFMEGLNELRREWQPTRQRQAPARRGGRGAKPAPHGAPSAGKASASRARPKKPPR